VTDRLRALPSVDRLATAVARAEPAERRAELLAGAGDGLDGHAGGELHAFAASEAEMGLSAGGRALRRR
jgi:hypothetical protein